MKKQLVFIAVMFCCFFAIAQEKTAADFQKELNAEYKDPEKSPLLKEDLAKFEALPFFEINEKFLVKARFKRSKRSKAFQMKTTTDRLPTYEKYGVASFEIDGKTYQLSIYQNHALREMEEYKDYLFLPFGDATNGEESYGGGRFIDLKIPDSDEIIIDFNQAYNPLCAYNHKYSCPIPPDENKLTVRIEAGVKYEAHD